MDPAAELYFFLEIIKHKLGIILIITMIFFTCGVKILNSLAFNRNYGFLKPMLYFLLTLQFSV